ncbi:hypothetical protein ES703_115492 [subsurface metagenome]
MYRVDRQVLFVVPILVDPVDHLVDHLAASVFYAGAKATSLPTPALLLPAIGPMLATQISLLTQMTQMRFGLTATIICWKIHRVSMRVTQII